MTRERFEDLTRDLVERTETTTSLVVKQAGLTWPQIDRVLLVGGSGRMPMIGQMLRKVTGKELDHSLSPDEVVAHGAALYAAMLVGDTAVPPERRCKLVNVNSHSLGVVGTHAQTKQKVNAVLIPKNTPLPCRAARTFRTARANQQSVCVVVVEGENQRPEACITLGECVVRRPAARTAEEHGRRGRICLRRRWRKFLCPHEFPAFATRGESRFNGTRAVTSMISMHGELGYAKAPPCPNSAREKCLPLPKVPQLQPGGVSHRQRLL